MTENKIRDILHSNSRHRYKSVFNDYPILIIVGKGKR